MNVIMKLVRDEMVTCRVWWTIKAGLVYQVPMRSKNRQNGGLSES